MIANYSYVFKQKKFVIKKKLSNMITLSELCFQCLKKIK